MIMNPVISGGGGESTTASGTISAAMGSYSVVFVDPAGNSQVRDIKATSIDVTTQINSLIVVSSGPGLAELPVGAKRIDPIGTDEIYQVTHSDFQLVFM